MQISRRAAAMGAAVFTGLATLGAAGAAFASPSAPAAHDGVQVLHLRAFSSPPPTTVPATAAPVTLKRSSSPSGPPPAPRQAWSPFPCRPSQGISSWPTPRLP